MAGKTRIQWADASFNPWWGCEKLSPACANCYAERDSNTWGHRNLWGPGSPRRFFGESHWKEPLKWNAAAADSGLPFRVFCASMGDVFEDRQDLHAPRAALFNLIDNTPALTWMLLTKRPQNMVRLAPERWKAGWPPRVWAMTTAENQEQADARIPELLRVPAEIIGVSMEPLLSRVILRSEWMKRISWVIVGGESGDRARPMHPFWARELRDQCRGAGIPFFFKQWGEWAPLDSEQWGKRGYADVEDGGSFPMRRVGKSRAGRLLFGQEYNEVPGDVTPKETH